MEEIFEKIEYYRSINRPFVVYTKPGTDVVKCFFQNSDYKYTLKSFNEEGFVFAPFSNTYPTAFIPFSEAEYFEKQIVVEGNANSLAGSFDVDTNAKTNFEELVVSCTDAIKTGKYDKLVASRTEHVNTTKSISEIYEGLLLNYPLAFKYCFYHPISGLWMGATPEQLLKATGATVSTVALAGTQVYVPDTEAIWEAKEQEEQQFVTDYITNRLQNVAFNMVCSAPYTFRAGNIIHIKTDISAVIKSDSNIGTIINLLHPTPAVCGLPKDLAMEFLLENEGYDRMYYSGFLGELNLDETSDLFVNLRSMKLEGNSAQLFIGCGITKDSNPEKEFFETVNKSVTMRKVL